MSHWSHGDMPNIAAVSNYEYYRDDEFVVPRQIHTMVRSVVWKYNTRYSSAPIGTARWIHWSTWSILAHFELYIYIYIYIYINSFLSANICTCKLPANRENIVQLKLTFTFFQWQSRHPYTVYRVHLGKSMIYAHYTYNTFGVISIATHRS